MKRIARHKGFVDLDKTLPHEQVSVEQVENLIKEIQSNKVLILPSPIIDEKTFTIIDGHHRLSAFRLLGFTRVPVTFIDYLNEDIFILQNGNYLFNKSDVIKSAAERNLLPRKSTSHHFRFEKTALHIEKLSDFVEICFPSKYIRFVSSNCE
jgi:hypothetical protein